MKQVIDGKLYDSSKAELVCEYEFGGPSDFRYKHERLFKTKKGAFFIAYVGGALTEYAESCGLTAKCEGEGIKPLTLQEAQRFCEEHGDMDDYVRAFGQPQDA